ncbi:hypothetical protein TNCV_4623541 [Trichonephila clavipes]|nr:hypothetical protein TNCV_4623541 [Trichonephila clavipes]
MRRGGDRASQKGVGEERSHAVPLWLECWVQPGYNVLKDNNDKGTAIKRNGTPYPSSRLLVFAADEQIFQVECNQHHFKHAWWSATVRGRRCKGLRDVNPVC